MNQPRFLFQRVMLLLVAAIVSFLPSRGSTTMPLDSKAPLCRSTGKSLLPCVLRGSFVSNGTVYMSTHDTFGCSKVRIFSDSLHISATEQVCPRQLSHKTPGLAILKTLTPLSRNNFHHLVDDLLAIHAAAKHLLRPLEIYLLPVVADLELSPNQIQRYMDLAVTSSSDQRVSRLHVLTNQWAESLPDVIVMPSYDPLRLPRVSFFVGSQRNERLHFTMPTSAPTVVSFRQHFANVHHIKHPTTCSVFPRIVLLSRSTASRRLALNEVSAVEHVELSIFPNTIEVIDLDRLIWRDQLELLSATDIIIGVHGAGLVNLLFVPEGSSVIEIFPPGFRRTTFGALAAAAGLYYSMSWGLPSGLLTQFDILGSHNASSSLRQHRRDSDFDIDANELELVLSCLLQRQKCAPFAMGAFK